MDGGRKKWTRVCSQRVKTGCRTCRIRRIKCDEQKPECFKCQVSQYKCDGYEDPRNMVDRRLRGTPKSAKSRSPMPTTVVPSPFMTMIDTDAVGALEERRSFHHFRTRTADDLSGSFESGFWSRLVLQLSHSEPAIKHALIALGAAHENYQADRVDSLIAPGLALKQYNRAISLLNQQISHPSRRATEVTLICCLIFVCFENVQGNYDAAIVHVKSGIGILKSGSFTAATAVSREAPYLDPETDEDELIELFTRLDVSASAFLDIQPPQLAINLSESLPGLASQRFRDLAEARKYLQKLVNVSFHHMRSTYQYRENRDLLPIGAVVERMKLMSALRHWAGQFDAFLKSTTMAELSECSLQGAFTLIIQQKTILIMLAVSPFSDMILLVPFEKDMESIISIAAWLNKLSGPLPEFGLKSAYTGNTQLEAGDTPKFTADMGIIAPLYYIAMNCPNFSLRRSALEILKIPRREGLWDSVLVSNIAEKIIEMDGQRLPDSFEGGVTKLAVALGATINPRVSR